jgi:hypothetical protein
MFPSMERSPVDAGASDNNVKVKKKAKSLNSIKSISARSMNDIYQIYEKITSTPPKQVTA